MGLDGRISCQGSISDALSKDRTLVVEVTEVEKAVKKAEAEVDPIEPNAEVKQADGKLVVAEEVAEGYVSWKAR